MKNNVILSFLRGAVLKDTPIYVQYAVSKFCNLKCAMCNAVEYRRPEEELTLEEIKKLVDTLIAMRVNIVILTGGEPFLRKDLVQVVRCFTDKGIEVRLQTNGLLVDEDIVKALIEAGVREVTLSLDTLNPEKQDRINQKKGSFEKILHAMFLFSKYLPRKANMTGVNTVVSRINIDDVVDVVKFITEVGFYSSVIPVHLAVQEDDFIVRKDADEFSLRQEDFSRIDDLYKRLIVMKRRGYHVHNTFRYLKESPEFLKYGKVSWKCDSPDLYFSISPSGRFLPCVDIDSSISMLEDDFLEKYHTLYRDQTRQIAKACKGCMYACYPEVSYFCNDPRVFMERLWQGVKVRGYTRRSCSSFSELLGIAAKHFSTDKRHLTKRMLEERVG